MAFNFLVNEWQKKHFKWDQLVLIQLVPDTPGTALCASSEGIGRFVGGGLAPVSSSKRKHENTVSQVVLCCVYRRVQCAKG